MRANGRFYKNFPNFFRRAGLPDGCSPARVNHWPESGAVTATVLTSENAPEFYARHLNLGAPEPAAEAVVESEPEKTVATEGASSEQQQEPDPQGGTEPPSKVHVRFSELTERAKKAETLAAEHAEKVETERRGRMLAEQTAAELRAKYEPPKADPLGPEPKPEQFVNTAEFAEALKDYTAEKVKLEIDTQQRTEQTNKAWNERQIAAKAVLPDYDAVIAAAADLAVTNEVRDAILESDQGAFILHHLAKNSAVVADLAAMKPEARLRYIGKLEGKFEAQAASKPATDGKSDAKPATAAAAEISRAPAPINPLRGSGSMAADVPLDAQGQFHGTAAQWRELRKAGKIK